MPLASLSSCLLLIEVYTLLSPSQPYKYREDSTMQVEHASLSLSLSVPLCVSQAQVFLFGIITKRPKNVLQVTTLQRPKGNNVIIALITTRPKCVY